jgi:hypothetical protein
MIYDPRDIKEFKKREKPYETEACSEGFSTTLNPWVCVLDEGYT